MSDESQTTQMNEDELLNKFYSEDITPDELEESKKETAEGTPDATSAESQEQQPTSEETSTEDQTKKPEAAADQPPSTSPDPNEWLAKLPEDVRKQVEEQLRQGQYWQQKHTELASRHRKANNELTTLKRKVSQQEEASSKTADPNVSDEDWRELEENDPRLAKLILKREAALRKEFEKQVEQRSKEAVEPIYQEQQDAYVQQQLDILTAYVPNWREINEDQYFKSWLTQATPGIQAMYNSMDARDSIRVLQVYAAEMQQYFGQPQQQAEQQAPQQQETAPPVSKVQQQRDAKLAKSAPIPAQPAGNVRPAQLTPDQLFKKLYEDPDAIASLLAKT